MSNHVARLDALNARLAKLEGIISGLEGSGVSDTSSNVCAKDVSVVTATEVKASTPCVEVKTEAVETKEKKVNVSKKPVKAKVAEPVAWNIHDYNPGFLPPATVDADTQYQNSVTNTSEDIAKAYNDNERRIRQVSVDAGLTSSVFYRAPASYYEKELPQRQEILNAPTIHYLCKTMLMNNTKCVHNEFSDYKDSKYYYVVVQYTARIHNERCGNAVRTLHNPMPSRNLFNFRVVSPEINAELSGYSFNGVTPLGSKERIPIILSHRIAELEEGFFWLGAGEVDLKWRISVKEFIKEFNPIIANITYDDE